MKLELTPWDVEEDIDLVAAFDKIAAYEVWLRLVKSDVHFEEEDATTLLAYLKAFPTIDEYIAANRVVYADSNPPCLTPEEVPVFKEIVQRLVVNILVQVSAILHAECNCQHVDGGNDALADCWNEVKRILDVYEIKELERSAWRHIGALYDCWCQATGIDEDASWMWSLRTGADKKRWEKPRGKPPHKLKLRGPMKITGPPDR